MFVVDQMSSGVVKLAVRCRRTSFLRSTLTRIAQRNTSRPCCPPSLRLLPDTFLISQALVPASRRPPLFRHTSTTPLFITTPSRACTSAGGSQQVRGVPAGSVTSRPCLLQLLHLHPTTVWSNSVLSSSWHQRHTLTGNQLSISSTLQKRAFIIGAYLVSIRGGLETHRSLNVTEICRSVCSRTDLSDPTKPLHGPYAPGTG